MNLGQDIVQPGVPTIVTLWQDIVQELILKQKRSAQNSSRRISWNERYCIDVSGLPLETGRDSLCLSLACIGHLCIWLAPIDV